MTINPTQDASSFQSAATLMDTLLDIYTGLPSFERKLLTYYSLATHSLPIVRLFPLAQFRGPAGTGKSCAIKVTKLFAYSPFCFSARGFTIPAIREKFKEAYNGTTLIEEGDSAFKYSPRQFEGLLSDRYHRDSSKEGHRVPDGDGGYVNEEGEFFGATVIHRRTPFADAGLDSRTIAIHFRPVSDKDFGEIDGNWEDEMSQEPEVTAIQGVVATLPQVERPIRIIPRIWEAYAPLFGMARLLGDKDFEGEVTAKIENQSAELVEAQATAELDGIVVRALIECSSHDGKLTFGQGISLRQLRSTVWENERIPVSPYQVGKIVSEFRFDKRKSHGVTKVYASPAKLISACDELGIEDEALEEHRGSRKKP